MGKDAKRHSKGIILNNTVRGKLVAMPWFGDFGILYFRKDLLTKYGYIAPPKTWAQLGTMAQKIQDGERANNPNFYGFVYQGNAYEGLTCDALEWLASSGGGQFIDGGKVTIDNPRAAAILNLQRSWVGKITPRGVTTYQEGESEKAFTAGNAAFMRNWPYAYAIGQDGPIKGKFDVTTLPRTGANAPVGTVGGWQLGVSSFSKQPLAAVELVRYLTSPAVERYNAIFNSNVPTIPSVAALPAVRKVNPWLKPEIANVKRVTRPSRFLGTKYNQGSQIIYQGINQILNGQDATNVLPGMAQRLDRAPARIGAAQEPNGDTTIVRGWGPSAPIFALTGGRDDERHPAHTPCPARRPRRRRSTRLQRRQTRLAWLMLTPALVVMAFIAFYPLGQTVYDSFTDRQFLGGLEPTRWVGLENYRDLIDDTIFRDAVVVTVKFTVITVSIELLLG